MEPNEIREHGWDAPAHLVPAIVLIGIGALFLLSNLHIIPSVNWFDFWPVILIAIGLHKLVEAGPGGGYVGGSILLGLGAVFLASNLGYLPVRVWDLWPLALIAVGVSLLVRRMTYHDTVGGASHWGSHWGRRNAYVADSSGDLNLAAVFSGGKRKITSGDFRGGVVSAVFGGFELDLRQATMKTDTAVIRIDAVFGGVEIKIPETWCAVVQGAGVFGGYSDETAHPPMTPETRKLIVKGGAVFGGVVVKN